MFHFPDLHLVTQKNIDWGKSLPGEAPMKLPTPSAIDNDVVVMAKTEFHNNETPFGLHTIDRRRHLYVLGKSGSGKSTLLANLIIQDLKNGHGIAVLDPHGDLYDTILDYIPPDRINDVVIFDPSIQETAAQLNLFSGATDVQKELLASGMVGVFRKIYSYSWGPRLEYILRNCILTLLTQEATLQDINRMLVDGDYRHRVVAQLQDPILVSFWQNEFEAMTEKLKQEAIAPILNKVGQFVSSPLIRNVLNVKQSTFNVETIMNEGKIFLANLSQGKLGEDNAALLGALLVTTFQIAAMSRAHKPESERKDFYLFIDEFQNFATTGFLKILSEARKYRLNLILANQYMDQMEPEVKDALFGNVGTLLSFVLGAKDADWLKREFGGLYTENDLVSLGKYQAIVKLIVDGETTPAFPAETLALFANKNGNRKKVLEQSAMRFGRKR
jgi:energy-coupling factor transporter ATP-binding protein EcfA2